jgi:hypothetical protein
VTCCYYNLLHAQQAVENEDSLLEGGQTPRASKDSLGADDEEAPHGQREPAVATVREFVVCLLLRCMPGDADLDLFRPELDRYCAERIRPHLGTLEAAQQAEHAAMAENQGETDLQAAEDKGGLQLPAPLARALQEWACVCVEYLSAIVEASRACLGSLLLAAMLGHAVTAEDPATAQRVSFLLDALSLSRLLHIGNTPAERAPAGQDASGHGAGTVESHTLIIHPEEDGLELRP